MPIKLKDIKEEFEKYIVIKDKKILDMVMAVPVGNLLIKRDPLWLMVVGVSSGGKSTLIAPCVDIPQLRFVDDLTEKTLLSGFKMKGLEQSLLKQIGSGILAFSDFTSILSKNPMSKGEILGQLRLVYDGNMTKATGTGTINWNGKMGFIAGVTPDVYWHMESGRSMGERFLYYWLEQPTDLEIATKQTQVNLSSKDITALMKDSYKDYFIGIREYSEKHGIPLLKMTDEQRFDVRAAAFFCINAKATVRLDFKTNKADSIPNKASVGRDYKAFETLLHTLQLMRCYEQDDLNAGVEEEDIALIRKCAYSSINSERRKILEILAGNEVAMTSTNIGLIKGLGLPKESVEKYLIPLNAIGLVQKHADSSSFKWSIADEDTRHFINRVSATMADPINPIILTDTEAEMESEVANF